MHQAFGEISLDLILSVFGSTGQDVTETLGAVLGAAGALLLAFRGERAGWGFVLFLASNILWLAFAAHARHWWLFTQQVFFTFTSLVGIWLWLLKPRLDAAVRDLFPETHR